jgi:uncharacterized protein YjbI with pentapeptide repeats
VNGEGATLREVDLSGVTVHQANLSGCDLRGSDLATVDPMTVDLRRSMIGWEQAVQLAEALGLDVRPD